MHLQYRNTLTHTHTPSVNLNTIITWNEVWDCFISFGLILFLSSISLSLSSHYDFLVWHFKRTTPKLLELPI